MIYRWLVLEYRPQNLKIIQVLFPLIRLLMDSITLSTSYPDKSNRTTVYDEIYDRTQVLCGP